MSFSIHVLQDPKYASEYCQLMLLLFLLLTLLSNQLRRTQNFKSKAAANFIPEIYHHAQL